MRVPHVKDQIEINSKELFASKIRTIARENNLDLVEAITSYCEDHALQMEDVLPLIDRSLKEEIRVAAINGNYVLGEKKHNVLF